MSTTSQEREADSSRAMLRHTLATLAYRAGKAVRGAPAAFAEYRCGERSRTPAQILAHMGDLMDWALHLTQGKHVWHDSKPFAWEQEVERFFAAVKAFDDQLASDEPLGFPAENLFQGPIADALTHTGQIALLRGMFGSRVKGENYSRADITAGRVGLEQAPPKVEF